MLLAQNIKPMQAVRRAVRAAPCSRHSLSRKPRSANAPLSARTVATQAVSPGISKSASKTAPAPSFAPSELIKVTFPDEDGDALLKDVTADLCYPKGEDGNPATPTGAIIFMHGFSQYPKSYFRTIQDLVARGYIIIAPYGGREALTGEGSLQDPRILELAKRTPQAERPGNPRTGPFAFLSPGANLRYATQLALKQDGQQCIKFVTKPDAAKFKRAGSKELERLSTYLPKGVARIGMCGHSMGAGLAFSLAAENQRVTAIGVMAPMINLEEAFEPLQYVDKSSFKDKSVLLLSGAWDFIAFPSDVEKLFKRIEASAAQKDNNVEYHKLPQYFHTSFEDQLTLGDLTLTSVVAVVLGVLYWAVRAAAADGLSGWEVWLQRLEILLLVVYVYLADVRPKFIQGTESRELINNFFTTKL